MMGGNMQNMIRQAQKIQQKMQEEMARVEAELKEKTVEASAGGGVVSVVVSGSKEVKTITLKPEVVDPDDIEMLQDLILAAVNEGLRKAEEMAAAEMKKVTGNIKMPGLF
ncbi:MAG: YbaB/EbfC family nucleoid-associated protein [Bacillota bacterium]